MKRIGTLSFAAAALAMASGSGAQTRQPALMVLGVPHFDNPGRDVANVPVEDVMTSKRQQEIERVVSSLARARPNHVAVEWPASDQAGLDRRYAAYRAGTYRLSRDERDQIGLRLASQLGLPRVDAVDWNEEPPGKDADYDFPAWLKVRGREAEFTTFQKEAQRDADAFAARNRCRPVADWLYELANPVSIERYAKPYYRIATFGDVHENPGAAWVGTWYARNLRIFANLLTVAGAANDRTIVIFGAGHSPLLQENTTRSGRFALLDPRQFLPSPAKRVCGP